MFRLEARVAVKRRACRRAPETFVGTGSPEAVSHVGPKFRLAFPEEVGRRRVAGVAVGNIDRVDRAVVWSACASGKNRRLETEKVSAARERQLHAPAGEPDLILSVHRIIALLQFDCAGLRGVRRRVVEAEIAFALELITGR